MEKRLAFISHDAGRTGAPILLLNLLKLLRTNGWETAGYIRNPVGPLLEEFRMVGAQFGTMSDKRAHWGRWYSRFAYKRAQKQARKKNANFPFLLSNTLTNGNELHAIRQISNCKIVTYAHELQIAVQTYTHPDAMRSTLEHTDLFVVPCEAVKRFLMESHQVSSNKIVHLDYYIPDLLGCKDGIDSENCSDQVMANQPVAIDERPVNDQACFVVGGCGTPDWRKGIDFFLLIAAEWKRKWPQKKARFIWKGVLSNSIEAKRIQYEVAKLKLDDSFVLMDSSSEICRFYQSLDLFMLTSREDPYPLVVLEAATFGVPTICFNKAGGAPEFVKDECGTVVDFLSISDCLSAIDRYREDYALLSTHSKNALNKVRLKHQQRESILRQFESICNRDV